MNRTAGPDLTDQRMALCALAEQLVADVFPGRQRPFAHELVMAVTMLAWTQGAACMRHEPGWAARILDTVASDGSPGDVTDDRMAAELRRQFPLRGG